MIFKNLKSTTRHLQPSRGFTLVEMLVVISIIGILSVIVFGSVSDSKARGRDSKRIADIGVIQLALERYYDDPSNKKYPTSANFPSALEGPIPKDPSTNVDYKYTPKPDLCTSTACQSYLLQATLELNNSVLDSDANTGNNSTGCKLEAGKKCYDVVPKF